MVAVLGSRDLGPSGLDHAFEGHAEQLADQLVLVDGPSDEVNLFIANRQDEWVCVDSDEFSDDFLAEELVQLPEVAMGESNVLWVLLNEKFNFVEERVDLVDCFEFCKLLSNMVLDCLHGDLVFVADELEDGRVEEGHVVVVVVIGSGVGRGNKSHQHNELEAYRKCNRVN